MKDTSSIYNTYDCINHINSDRSSETLQLDPIYGWRVISIKNTDFIKD